MASGGRTAELPTRFLSFSAVRFASHRGVEALPQPTSRQEKGTDTKQDKPTIYCLLHAILLDCLREGHDTRGRCGFLFVRRWLLLRHEPREVWM